MLLVTGGSWEESRQVSDRMDIMLEKKSVMATFFLSKKPLNHKRSIWGLRLQCFGGPYLGDTRAFMSATITVICILWLYLQNSEA